MKIRALTIVVIEAEENKPPAFTLVGNLPAQEAYVVLHDFMLQAARQEGEEKAKGAAKIPKAGAKPSQQARSDSEGEVKV